MGKNVEHLGQVFTPPEIAEQMLQLRRNQGSTLEPSAGDGAFYSRIPDCVGVEIDPKVCEPGMINADFFDFPTARKFDTIIGNPPYVRYQDIPIVTKRKFTAEIFDERSNLYLFFIEKCLRHLNAGGELIFITPRDFLKSTASRKLNALLYESGTITDYLDLGDKRIFGDFTPNCCIWRFEKGNLSHKTFDGRYFNCKNGQILFTRISYPHILSDLFFVKVGAVSGCDNIFINEQCGNADFVCSETVSTGRTRRMIFNELNSELLQHKEQLLTRKIKQFGENNWWEWGRVHYHANCPRIYVNCKTRVKEPFFLHPSAYYDGSVLALFPRNTNVDIRLLLNLLNGADWNELGFVCGGRFLFSQRSLENAPLSDAFAEFIPQIRRRLSVFNSLVY